jgi:thiol-disulfide isomerase/thioredoxin
MYADTNRHGAWTDADALTCTKKTGQSRSSAVSDQFVYFLPLPPSSPWRALPLTVAAAWKTPNTDNRPPDFLFLSGGVTVEGSVSVGGHDVLVRYADNIDVTTGVIDPTHGIVQMDSNGDGRIDSGNYSLEFEMPHGASPVFHVGSVYLATKTVDPRTKTVVLVEHPASDYLRIPMVLGTQVPDLTFTDFNGATRRLSDFKGKYVLLDFWGTWCGPCVADIPELVKVYEQYRGRGVEILGMDNEFTGQNGKNPDEMTAQAKTLLAEKGATWTQARTESVEPIEDRFRIGYHPMYMLLDPDRHIVFWNEPGQQAVRAVAETLDRVLPKGGTSGR